MISYFVKVIDTDYSTSIFSEMKKIGDVVPIISVSLFGIAYFPIANYQVESFAKEMMDIWLKGEIEVDVMYVKQIGEFNTDYAT